MELIKVDVENRGIVIIKKDSNEMLAFGRGKGKGRERETARRLR